MITLYHGSPFKVEHPLVKAGRKNLDFGPGFYKEKKKHERFFIME